MGDGEFPSVEHLPREVGASAVGAVAGDGVAEVLQMHADLVGSSGFGSAFDERKISAGEKNAPEGFGGAGAGALAHAHALAVDGMAGDGAGDAAGSGAGASAHDGEIRFAGGPVGELPGQVLVGKFIFRHEDAAAGVLVQSVDDTGAERVTAFADGAAMVEDGVDEGAVPMTNGGMDDEAGGFVEAEEGGVLIQNIERDIFGAGLDGRGLGCGGMGEDAIAGVDGIGGAGGLLIDGDETGGESFLPAGAADLRVLHGEPTVETRGGSLGHHVQRVLHEQGRS